MCIFLYALLLVILPYVVVDVLRIVGVIVLVIFAVVVGSSAEVVVVSSEIDDGTSVVASLTVLKLDEDGVAVTVDVSCCAAENWPENSEFHVRFSLRTSNLTMTLMKLTS